MKYFSILHLFIRINLLVNFKVSSLKKNQENPDELRISKVYFKRYYFMHFKLEFFKTKPVYENNLNPKISRRKATLSLVTFPW